MEHTNKEKLERNQAIFEYMQNHPEATMKDAGDVFGLTSQNIFRVLAKRGRRRTCLNCYHYIGANLCRYHERVPAVGPCNDWRTKIKGSPSAPRVPKIPPGEPLENKTSTREDTLQAIKLRKERGNNGSKAKH